MRVFDYQELVNATDNFNLTRVIGKGSHGLVYKGILFKDHHRLVAIKKASEGLGSLDNDSKLENEIQVLSSLQASTHVVKFLGTSCSYEQNKVIVMELMPNGSLYEWLHAAKTPPTWPKRVEIAIQIARAVQFLHESNKPWIIHRDIKSTNILFDSQWNAKLADFGLAVTGMEPPTSQPAGTIGYIDPSYTTASKLSTKNDMFSFGVVLLEIISGRKAIDLCKSPASIVDWATPLIQQQLFEEICDTRMMALTRTTSFMVRTITQILRDAARCVSPDEDGRPSVGEVVMGLENCFLERVRYFPTIWTNLLKNLARLRKRKMIMNITRHAPAQEEPHGDGDNTLF